MLLTSSASLASSNDSNKVCGIPGVAQETQILIDTTCLYLIFPLSMLVLFGSMDALHHCAARKGSSSHIWCCFRWAAIGVALGWAYTEAITAEENAHWLPHSPSSSKVSCVNYTLTFVYVYLLPNTDGSFQDTPWHRKIQCCTESSVLHSGLLLLVAPWPIPIHHLTILVGPWSKWSAQGKTLEIVDSWEERLEIQV